MNASLMDELATRVQGQVTFGAQLARYTTFRIGGPATALVSPDSTQDVVEVVRLCFQSGTSWLPLGLGSNMLVADGGFDGVVIHMGRAMGSIDRSGDGEEWRVGAGLPTPRLARRTAKAGLNGIQKLIGVPGTVGGGVAMNAGAHGQDFSQTVRSVELVEADGTVREVATEDIAWRYRGSGISGATVTCATFEFCSADSAEMERDIKRHFKWRRAGTPFDEPCCGSVFRNPASDETATGPATRTAGRCVDAVGLKGFRIGGAQVSQKHANYIVNVGGATADDVKAVIDAVREKVLTELGIELRLEVKLIG